MDTSAIEMSLENRGLRKRLRRLQKLLVKTKQRDNTGSSLVEGRNLGISDEMNDDAKLLVEARNLGTSDEMNDGAKPCSQSFLIIASGDISQQQVSFWSERLRRQEVNVVKTFSTCVTHIVTSCNIELPTLLKKTGLRTIDELSGSVKSILIPDWIVQYIKTGEKPSEHLFLHPLQHQLYNRLPLCQNAKPSILENHSSQRITDSSIDDDGDKVNRVSGIGFACKLSGTLDQSINLNKSITGVFDELQEFYELKGDEFRSLAYQRVSSILKFKPRILHVADISDTWGIGKSIESKIQEILETGTLKKLENFRLDPRLRAIQSFCKVWGIGPKTADDLYKKGLRSISDLRNSPKLDDILTVQQRIGLAHYEDLQIRIPRSEVVEIEKVVRECAVSLIPGVQCVTCGSFRRGKPDSGDVDVLIGPPDGFEYVTILTALVDRLRGIGFLTADLALNYEPVDDEEGGDGTSKRKGKEQRNNRTNKHLVESYMGICKLMKPESIQRRLDIKCYPRSKFAFALLYFTGSDHFNRSMRSYAHTRGYSLSDKSLKASNKRRKYSGKGSNQNSLVVPGSTVQCLTERDIFDALELDYKEPWERNCFDIGK